MIPQALLREGGGKCLLNKISSYNFIIVVTIEPCYKAIVSKLIHKTLIKCLSQIITITDNP